MARTKAQKKGDALEEAVHMIEELILRSNPNTKDATITIETKKRIKVQGVRSEIDVYVCVELGNGLKLIYIFECRNREEPVGRKDITDFHDKIEEVGAARGYFVAKKFGIDAINKAKRFQRLELLNASDEFEELPEIVTHLHYLFQMLKHTNIALKVQTDDPQKVGSVAVSNTSKVKLGDEELLLGVLTERIQQNVMNEVMSHEPTESFPAGVYSYDRQKTYTFHPNELFVDGFECTELTAQVSWDIQVIRPRVVSTFDIEKRGRVFTVESGEQPPGVNIQMSYIEAKEPF